jgi:hypothetical protein
MDSIFYYCDDGTKFTSKVKALHHARQYNTKVHFYYHDDVYSQLDWKIEPPQSLDYYYREQAQRIRDNYDYVILCYSGGYDSSNILETFHYNNIKLDKIVTVGALSQDSAFGVDDNHNGELYHNVFPYLKELGLDTITQVCDYTDYFNNLNNFSISTYDIDWVDHTGAWYSPHNWFWKDIEQYVVPREWHGKRVALLFGKDKPSLFYHQAPGKHAPPNGLRLNSFCFRDTPCTSYGNSSGLDNCDRINFYWDPSSPEILIKQLHLLYKVYSIQRTTSYDPSIGAQMLGDVNINDVVYNLKRPILFKSPKSKDSILSLRDTYLKEKQNSDVYEMYAAGIEHIGRTVGLNNMTPIQTKFYPII